ncbi:MAG: S9 family peptidase [Bacteroidota bacterium]
MKKISALSTCLLVFILYATAQNNKIVPAFEQVISLQRPSNPILSPDGKHTLFTVSSTDWENNRFDTEIWLSKNDEEPFQLTRTEEGSSFSPAWSPDGKYITFKAKRGKNTQIHAIAVAGGEAFPVTSEKGNIGSYECSPDGKQIAFTMQPDREKEEKERKEKYGAFEEDDAEYKLSWLYVIDFEPNFTTKLPCYDKKDSTAQVWKCQEMPKAKAIIDSVDYTIRNFQWSPDGKQIAFSHTPDPLINSFFDADISVLNLENKAVKALVTNPSADFLADWSPDSKSILYSSNLDDRVSNYYKNGKYFILNLDSKQPQQIATTFDEYLSNLTWTEKGIFATAWQRTTRPVLQINSKTDEVRIYRSQPTNIYGFSFDKNTSQIALYGENGDDLSEIYRSDFENTKMIQLTNYSQQIDNWQTAKSEIINWKSKDGALIEGILHKSADYDPNKKYPLLVMIHGGPTGIDRPTPVPGYVYPALQWLAKGALILRPNYRGSAGYGEKFRELNVENLGVGDAWDVHSGIDYLAGQGIIDTTKMGAMGWSQGGYISAFLTTTSNRFKAISVGAGISNWMTYYVNTDIHPFTRQYLKATPWSNEEVYRKTSPMTYINQASTPTLIQHGEFDRRVPVANAYELLQGLRDQNVEAKLMIYKGFGHGISKPKERLAAITHNWEWFNQYIWEEE